MNQAHENFDRAELVKRNAGPGVGQISRLPGKDIMEASEEINRGFSVYSLAQGAEEFLLVRHAPGLSKLSAAQAQVKVAGAPHFWFPPHRERNRARLGD
jgi:hypothetical protein